MEKEIKRRDFVKAMKSAKNSLDKNGIYKVVEIGMYRADGNRNVPCIFCYNKSRGIIVCSERTKIILECVCTLKVYTGPEENTVCYNCENRILCEIERTL